MNNGNIINGSNRTVILGKKFVFKIPKGDNGIEENKSEIELCEELPIILNTQNLGSLGITSLDTDKILGTKLENKDYKIDDFLLSEIINVSDKIKEIIIGMKDVDISNINIQKRLNLNMELSGNYFFNLSMSGLVKDFISLIQNCSFGNTKDKKNFDHTLKNYGNYGLTEYGEVLLLDGGITGEGKKEFLKISDSLYEIMNNKLLIAQTLEKSEYRI